MERALTPMPAFGRSATAGFLAIGLALYVGLFAASEWLVYRNGDSNPFYKIENAASPQYDWVILGASHAMPLDFADFNAVMEQRTGKRIINLAGPGTGPLYSRFVLEHFLRHHSARHVLYVADGFAFRSRAWNEERLADAKLLSRTPFDPALAAILADYVLREHVDPRGLLDYVTGFSKINNRERFRLDVWEGEANFDRAFRPSRAAEKKRVEYLYPPVVDEIEARRRYLSQLVAMISDAKSQGADVTIAKFPLPPRFKALLRDEETFDTALRAVAEAQGAAFIDLSGTVAEPRFYADTDHLNREGVTVFLRQHLERLLADGQ